MPLANLHGFVTRQQLCMRKSQGRFDCNQKRVIGQIPRLSSSIDPGPSSRTHDMSGASEAMVLQIIESIQAGEIDAAVGAKKIAAYASGLQQVEDFATLDTGRAARTGLPEVVYGPGKSPEQIASIMSRLCEHQRTAIATRITPDVYAMVRKHSPGVEYNARARTLLMRSPHWDSLPRVERLAGSVAVVCSGTADLGVAEECRIVAEAMGCYVFQVSDVCVAGLHRVLTALPAIRAASVVIAVAGTDGVLPSIMGGLVDAPVIAVPTSVGYGAALEGLTPLFAALNSSSPGVTVVNIDNGFGAAMMAARMLRMATMLHKQRAAAEARPATGALPTSVGNAAAMAANSSANIPAYAVATGHGDGNGNGNSSGNGGVILHYR